MGTSGQPSLEGGKGFCVLTESRQCRLKCATLLCRDARALRRYISHKPATRAFAHKLSLLLPFYQPNRGFVASNGSAGKRAYQGCNHAKHAHTRISLQVRRHAVASEVSESLTERMFEQLAQVNSNDPQATGAGGATTLEDLRRMDKIWHSIRHNPPADPPQVVSASFAALGAAPDFDVIVCGGTLGIFLATALQRSGVKVAVLERGKLKGRAQEWNVSRAEMQTLVELGVLSQEDFEQVLVCESCPIP